MGLITRIAVGSAAVTIGGGALLFGTRIGADASSGDERPGRLIELADCASRGDQTISTTSGDAGARSTGAAAQSIAVQVPATVILRLDDHGRVLTAVTNTGCAPRADDDLWVWQSDGTLAPGGLDVSRISWSGDFTVPGRLVPQHR